MYVLRSVPELKQKIDQGTLCITTVAQVERYIRQEQVEAGVKPTQEQKREFFESFENKSSTEVRNEIAERRGERIRLKLALELDEEAEALWTQVRNLSAHQTQGSALNCLKVLMKSYLAQQDRKFRKPSTRKTEPASQEHNSPLLEPSNSSFSGEGSSFSSQDSCEQSRRTTSSLTKVRTADPRDATGTSTNARTAGLITPFRSTTSGQSPEAEPPSPKTDDSSAGTAIERGFAGFSKIPPLHG